MILYLYKYKLQRGFEMTTTDKSSIAIKKTVVKKRMAVGGSHSKQVKLAIKEAKIASLKEVISEIEVAIKEFGYGKETIVNNILNLDDKEPSASINMRYFGSWGQYEGEALPQLDLEAATFLTDTVERIMKAYPKFGIGWLAGDDYDVHINIRNCRSDTETKQQAGFVEPPKVVKERKPNVPSDAAVKRLKIELVKEVGRSLMDDIKTIKGGDNAVFTSTTKPHLNNPAVIIRIKYLGTWEYCKQRKRMHVTAGVASRIDACITKLTDQHPKFVIEWDTDDRLFIHVAVKNQQPRSLALLKGVTPENQVKKIDAAVEDNIVTLTNDSSTSTDNIDQLLDNDPIAIDKPTEHKVTNNKEEKDVAIEDNVVQLVAVAATPITATADKMIVCTGGQIATAKEVGSEIRKNLEFDHPLLAGKSAWYGQTPPILPSTGDEWYEEERADGSVIIGCKNLGDDYIIPNENSHDLEMSELTKDYVQKIINKFRKNHPELIVNWSQSEQQWFSAHIKIKEPE